MNTKQLRQKILDLAIRGKLVPQDPADEPASALLERIAAEKARLVKEGKIKADKKPKNTPVTSDKSHYGELPQGWELCRLSSLATFSGGKTPSTVNALYWNGNINWVTSKDMKQKYIDSTQIKLSKLGAEQMQIFSPNTLLMVVRSGILRHTLPLSILTTNATVNQDLKTISFFEGKLCQFVYVFFSALNDYILVNYHKDGTTVDSINFEDLKEIIIPIPPLAEQHRIVTAVESAFAVIDEIERSKTDLQTAVTAAKRKILSLAVSGKLVPQDPDDEPAAVLLERIKNEREKLIKAGKIKADKKKKSVESTRDNSHYGKLPAGWGMARLSELGQIVGGGTPSTKESEYWNGDIAWITPADLSKYTDKYISRGSRNITQSGLASSSAIVMPVGSVLMSSRAPIGYCAILSNKASTNQGFKSVVPYITAINEYLYYYLLAVVEDIRSRASGTTFKEISGTEFGNTIVCLPPIAEQFRVVSAVESAYMMLDAILSNI